MVCLKQVAALAAASYAAGTYASAIPDLIGGGGAPQPSIPANRERSNGISKRQTAGGFIDMDAGPITSDCGVAATFSLNTLGQLVVGDSVISMNPGTTFIPLRPISPPGSITVTFALNNGALTWSNANFFGGQAGFCQDTAGQVYATFADPAVSYPANCAPVQLGPVVASTCGNTGGLSTTSAPPSGSVTTVGSTIVSTGPGGSLTTTVNSFATTLAPPFTAPTTSAVANGTLTLPPGLYTVAGFATPAGAVCSIVSESWIVGQTTLLSPLATRAV
ncbi:hypothetical protein BDP81DRAFT_445882 [Colletotrichum phormii]|uniref:DUF7908 domain-containing protein n=1 Tax=Colletotrichum phormii TaxID=359342 RepID=A0AAJ0A2F4_9PEZI|nr:uncharacterized protein BDP81DRAFT_445882 [Colletotrichum phormii]KAK1640877.1 hypothetical protein BDP81DRAFT_445882 [Colletotrichum phormii]